MNAIDTAKSGIQQPTPEPDATPRAPGAAEVTSWLLEGRFFTVGAGGAITSWSPGAQEAFGWTAKEATGSSFAEKLLAPAAQAAEQQRVERLFAGDEAGFGGAVDALDASGRPRAATLALVPIHLGVGYEFNELLQEIAARSRNADSLAELQKRHASVLSLIEDALSGRAADRGKTDEGGRLAGALVVFHAAAGSAPAVSAPVAASAAGSASDDAAPIADNVVSIADAAGLEEARAQLERARRDAEEGRVEVRNLEGQLEEARREATRSRNEADVARQAASDARDSLTVAHRDNEEAKRQLEDARRAADELRASAEEARIRSEEAQREADSLRAQLRESRESARGLAGRADDELAQAQQQAAAAERELAEARAEAARHEAEVAPLRERYQAGQRDLGSLRAELEVARASVAEAQARVEKSAAEAERARNEVNEARTELDRTRTEIDEARAELEALRSASQQAPATAAGAVHAGSAELGRMRTAFERSPVGGALLAPDGRYLEVNAALCAALGHSRDALLSAEPPVIVHPEDAAAKRELAERMLAGEQASARGRRRYVHASGRVVDMRESIALVRDGEGRPDLFVVHLEELDTDSRSEAVDAAVAADGTELVPAQPSGDSLRRALEDDMFQLHCQPVLDLRTNAVSQYELLIRMVAEDGRVILPQAFLEPARRAGLAHAIDRWVVREAIRLLHERQLAGEEVSLEVNLSPEAVHDEELPAMIDAELTATPIDPTRLVLEVTGATAAEDIEATRELARRLRGLGCRFALDDFRSNFGSFRLLKDLPLDYLKLDGDLVGSLAESRTSQLIVKALVDVAAGTGMKTVAVFVSDDETLSMLRQQGVDYAQGYRVGRPRPVAETFGSSDGAAARRGDTRRLPPGEDPAAPR